MGMLASDLSDPEHSRCMERLESTISSNRVVQKLIDNIDTLGCKIPKDFFACRKCDSDMTGGFMLPQSSMDTSTTYLPRIVLCENKKIDRQTFDNTVIHELIHAYDVCRANIDFKNCLHHACTEIRASSLSGECSMARELHRGQYNIRAGHPACVRRRAEISLSSNPNCKVINPIAPEFFVPNYFVIP